MMTEQEMKMRISMLESENQALRELLDDAVEAIKVVLSERGINFKDMDALDLFDVVVKIIEDDDDPLRKDTRIEDDSTQ